MHMVNLAGIDLNLAVALEALLDEAHVGRAGRRIGLSQPATSHALGRLRALFDDPLLVRSGAGMALTPRAEALRAPVARFVAAANELLTDSPFDPASSRRRFRLMLPGPTFHLLMPALVGRLQADAPGIVAEGIAWRGPDLLTAAALGAIDFIVTSLEREIAGFDRHWLYDDRDMIVVRAGHPRRADLRSVGGLAACRHVAVVGAGETADVLDTWLQAQGIHRIVAAVAPGYPLALAIAAASDLVAIIPGKFAASLAPALGLELLELPVDPGVDSHDILSPVRARSDPATIWMRDYIRDLAATL